MQKATFEATCPFEIGDVVFLGGQTPGKTEAFAMRVRTITDIACIHYVKTGSVKFLFELDHSGKYEPLTK